MSRATRTRPIGSLPTPSARIAADGLGKAAGLAVLIVSAVALGIAPLVVDDSYSWVEQAVSESGGQGVDGAWVARTGLLLLGLAVIWIASVRRERWGRPATAFHLTFAVCMVAAAAYSLRSWIPDTAFDATEDLLHSVAASVMGFAFAFGVAAVALRLRKNGHRWRALDVAAVTATVVVAIGMGMFGSVAGALQRLLFVITYVWYGRELLTRTEAST